MVARMKKVYSANPTRETAEELAVEFEKPVRSVIAKLSNMGIYKAQARVTKSGAPVSSQRRHCSSDSGNSWRISAYPCQGYKARLACLF